MRLRVVYDTWIVPPRNRAWVMYPFMLFRERQEDVNDWLFRHEWEHVEQVRREGWFKFYIKYIWYSILYGYKNNPYEVEARSVQDRPLTAVQRYYKDKRYLLGE